MKPRYNAYSEFPWGPGKVNVGIDSAGATLLTFTLDGDDHATEMLLDPGEVSQWIKGLQEAQAMGEKLAKMNAEEQGA